MNVMGAIYCACIQLITDVPGIDGNAYWLMATASFRFFSLIAGTSSYAEMDATSAFCCARGMRCYKLLTQSEKKMTSYSRRIFNFMSPGIAT